MRRGIGMPADILKVVNIWQMERQNFRLPNRAEQARRRKEWTVRQ
jgi:hypothetical protein